MVRVCGFGDGDGDGDDDLFTFLSVTHVTVFFMFRFAAKCHATGHRVTDADTAPAHDAAPTAVHLTDPATQPPAGIHNSPERRPTNSTTTTNGNSLTDTTTATTNRA